MLRPTGLEEEEEEEEEEEITLRYFTLLDLRWPIVDNRKN